MKCLYCDKTIEKQSLKSVFLKQDLLCLECREKLRVERKTIKIDGISIETFFDYDGFYRDLLIQYKECFDEALKDVFLYDIVEYLRIKYHGCHIAYVPSSETKLALRGFNHLELMFEELGLKKVEGIYYKQNLVQEGKSGYERRKIINNYYYQGPKYDKILLVDDMLTTGSSILGVYKQLIGNCRTIKVIVLGCKRKRFQLKKNSDTI